MARKWAEVVADERYQALPFKEKEDARIQYFYEAVVPQITPQEINDAWAVFNEHTIFYDEAKAGESSGSILETQGLPPTPEGYDSSPAVSYNPAIQSFSSSIDRYSKEYDVDPYMLDAMIMTESNGDPDAVSHTGVRGLMQVTNDTVKYLNDSMGTGIDDRTDPDQSIRGGAAYLSYLMNRYEGSIDNALIAYNAGPKAVDRWIALGRPADGEGLGGPSKMKEAINYTKRVKSFYQPDRVSPTLKRNPVAGKRDAELLLIDPDLPKSADQAMDDPERSRSVYANYDWKGIREHTWKVISDIPMEIVDAVRGIMPQPAPADPDEGGMSPVIDRDLNYSPVKRKTLLEMIAPTDVEIAKAIDRTVAVGIADWSINILLETPLAIAELIDSALTSFEPTKKLKERIAANKKARDGDESQEVLDPDKAALLRLREMNMSLRDKLDRWKATPEGLENAPRLQRNVLAAAESIAHMGASIATGRGNVLKSMGLDVFGGQYSRLRDEGYSPEGSLVIASMYSGAELIGENVPMDILFKKWGKNWLMEFGKFMLAEGLQEHVTFGLEKFTEFVTENQDMTWDEFRSAHKDLLVVLGISLPIVGGMTKAAQKTADTFQSRTRQKQWDSILDDIREQQVVESLRPKGPAEQAAETLATPYSRVEEAVAPTTPDKDQQTGIWRWEGGNRQDLVITDEVVSSADLKAGDLVVDEEGQVYRIEREGAEQTGIYEVPDDALTVKSGQFAKSGLVSLVFESVETRAGLADKTFRRIKGKPSEAAQASVPGKEDRRVAVAPPSEFAYTGKYSDGEEFKAEYNIIERSDGSFGIERNINGEGKQNLRTNGTWGKGGAPKTTFILGKGVDELEGPESFPTRKAAVNAIKDDAEGMGGKAVSPKPEVADKAAKAQAITQKEAEKLEKLKVAQQAELEKKSQRFMDNPAKIPDERTVRHTADRLGLNSKGSVEVVKGRVAAAMDAYESIGHQTMEYFEELPPAEQNKLKKVLGIGKVTAEMRVPAIQDKFNEIRWMREEWVEAQGKKKAETSKKISEANRRRMEVKKDDSLDTRIIKGDQQFRGLDADEAVKQGIDPEDLKIYEPGIGKLFRSQEDVEKARKRGGDTRPPMSFDHAAEMLRQAGFEINDPNELLDVLYQQVLQGEKVMPLGMEVMPGDRDTSWDAVDDFGNAAYPEQVLSNADRILGSEVSDEIQDALEEEMPDLDDYEFETELANRLLERINAQETQQADTGKAREATADKRTAEEIKQGRKAVETPAERVAWEIGYELKDFTPEQLASLAADAIKDEGITPLQLVNNMYDNAKQIGKYLGVTTEYINEIAQAIDEAGLYIDVMNGKFGDVPPEMKRSSLFRKAREEWLSDTGIGRSDFRETADGFMGMKAGDRVMYKPSSEGSVVSGRRGERTGVIVGFEKSNYWKAYILFDDSDSVAWDYEGHSYKRLFDVDGEKSLWRAGKNEPTIAVGSQPDDAFPSPADKSVRYEDAGITTDQGRLLQEMGQYDAKITEVMHKENMQNHFDAVMEAIKRGEIEQGTIDIVVSEENRTIEFTDNGIGMTPDEVKAAFLRLFGSGKSVGSAGGFGLAKIATLLRSESFHLITTRDGVTTEYKATPETAINFEGKKGMKIDDESSLPNGSTLKIVVPKTQENEEGEHEDIEFYRWPELIPIYKKPLIGNVVVRFKDNDTYSPEFKTLDLGANQSNVEQFNGLKHITTLEWTENGTKYAEVDIYLGEKEKQVTTWANWNETYGKHFVLVNGIWQFDMGIPYTAGRMGETIPYDVILNVRPFVPAEHSKYPFNKKREGFNKRFDEVLAPIYVHLTKIAYARSITNLADDFVDVKYLDDNLSSVITEDAKTKYEAEDPTTPPRVYTQGDTVFDVNGKAITVKSDELNIDTELSKVDIEKLDDNTPIFHSNLAWKDNEEPVDAIQWVAARAGVPKEDVVSLLQEAGRIFIGMREKIGVLVKQDHEWIRGKFTNFTHEDPKSKRLVGISIETTDDASVNTPYYGLAIASPFDASLWNIGSVEGFESPDSWVTHAIDVMLHELNHDNSPRSGVKSHNTDFVYTMANILKKFPDLPSDRGYDSYSQELWHELHAIRGGEQWKIIKTIEELIYEPSTIPGKSVLEGVESGREDEQSDKLSGVRTENTTAEGSGRSGDRGAETNEAVPAEQQSRQSDIPVGESGVPTRSTVGGAAGGMAIPSASELIEGDTPDMEVAGTDLGPFLARLDTSEEAANLLARVVKMYEGQMRLARRGVRTWEEANADAQELLNEWGITGKPQWRPGDTVNDAEWRARFLILRAATDEIYEQAEKTYENQSNANMIELLRMTDNYEPLLQEMLGLRAEWGRTGSIMRQMATQNREYAVLMDRMAALEEARRNRGEAKQLELGVPTRRTRGGPAGGMSIPTAKELLGRTKNKLTEGLTKEEEIILNAGGKGFILKKAEILVDLKNRGYLTKAQSVKLARDLAKQRDPTTSEKIIEIWINWLLSGPQTHIVNITSNSLVSALSIPETAVAAIIGKLHGGDKVYGREVLGRVSGLAGGVNYPYDLLKHALSEVAAHQQAGIDIAQTISEIYRTEGPESLSKAELTRRKAIGGVMGKLIRAPTFALQLEDTFFKAIAWRQEAKARAIRQAIDEGLKGKAMRDRAAKIFEEVHSLFGKVRPELADVQPDLVKEWEHDQIYWDIFEASWDTAHYQTFTNKMGAFASTLSTLANRHADKAYGLPSLGLKFLVPFMRTPVNIVKFAGARTPAGFMMPSVKAQIRAGGAYRDMAVARIMVGSSIMWTIMAIAFQGGITGGGPDDPAERKVWLMKYQPYSIKIGKEWYSYQRLEPIGMLFGISADLADSYLKYKVEGATATEVGGLLYASVIKNISSKTFMKGLSDAIMAYYDPERYGDYWIHQFAGTAIPTGIAQWARTEDPVLRRADTLMGKMKSRIPGLSKDLLFKPNIFGEPIYRKGGLGPDWLSPVYLGEDPNDPVLNEMIDVDAYPGMPGKYINDVKLTEAQQNEYTIMAGQQAKRELDILVSSPGYKSLPRWSRREIIMDTFTRARENARLEMQVRYQEQLMINPIREELLERMSR